jgi:hypothetical protein
MLSLSLRVLCFSGIHNGSVEEGSTSDGGTGKKNIEGEKSNNLATLL